MIDLFKDGEFVKIEKYQETTKIFEILAFYHNKKEEVTEFNLLNIISNKGIVVKLDEDDIDDELSQEFNIEQSQLIQNYLKLEKLEKLTGLIERLVRKLK